MSLVLPNDWVSLGGDRLSRLASELRKQASSLDAKVFWAREKPSSMPHPGLEESLATSQAIFLEVMAIVHTVGVSHEAIESEA
jgi:hypothetical protein